MPPYRHAQGRWNVGSEQHRLVAQLTASVGSSQLDDPDNALLEIDRYDQPAAVTSERGSDQIPPWAPFLGDWHHPSFDNLVGAGEECGRDFQPDGACGALVDRQGHAARRVERQIGNLGAAEQPVDVLGCPLKILDGVRSVGGQAALLGLERIVVHGWQPADKRTLDDLPPMDEDVWRRHHDQTIEAVRGNPGEYL